MNAQGGNFPTQETLLDFCIAAYNYFCITSLTYLFDVPTCVFCAEQSYAHQ